MENPNLIQHTKSTAEPQVTSSKYFLKITNNFARGGDEGWREEENILVHQSTYINDFPNQKSRRDALSIA